MSGFATGAACHSLDSNSTVTSAAGAQLIKCGAKLCPGPLQRRRQNLGLVGASDGLTTSSRDHIRYATARAYVDVGLQILDRGDVEVYGPNSKKGVIFRVHGVPRPPPPPPTTTPTLPLPTPWTRSNSIIPVEIFSGTAIMIDAVTL